MENLPFILTVTIMFTLLFFMIGGILGGILGWMLKQSQFEKNYIIPNLHPEMFDENGNVLPDEILAIRFENENDHECEDDEDD